MKKSKNEKDAQKRYEEYVSRFTPGSRSVSNGIKAFVVQNFIQQNFGLESKEAGTIVTVGLIFAAQLLTGLGLYAPLAKFAGAGVIVPITGFANSMVATAMEFKSEGPVLGVGSKLFQLAGPVIVCGISVSVIVGLIYYVMGIFDFKLPWV